MSTDGGDYADARRLSSRHRCLLALARETDACEVQAVINLGAAVLLHGDIEGRCLERVLRLVDPAVHDELEADHTRLAKDLQFLRETVRADPASADVEVVAEALLERLRQHLDRDQRTLYQPLLRLTTEALENLSPAHE